MSSIRETPAFQFTGGHPCLDFANTLDYRGRPNEVDLLGHYHDLVAFAELTGIVSAADARLAVRASERDPAAAERVLRQARTLREAIFSIFSAVTARRSPSAAALEELNSVVSEAGSNREVASGTDQFTWQWRRDDGRLEWILWPIALAAAELLVSDNVLNVRSCASETCDWLFLDHSKSHSRRWCDMKTCGNRYKARRFYAARRSAQKRRG